MELSNIWTKVPGSNLARSSFHKVFGKKNEIYLENLDLKLSEKVYFLKVEKVVDNFVENEVPFNLDQLYKLSNEIEKLDGNDENLTKGYHKATQLIKKLNDKVVEIDELRNYILDSDLDYFDLRIKPTKHKINQAIIHIYDVTNLPLTADLPVNPTNSIGEVPIGRSPKARDLLSILSDEEEANLPNISTSDSTDQLQVQIEKGRLDFNNDISEESLNNLNKDLVDLHDIMKTLHASVHEQGHEVNEISDNVKVAEVNIQEGNIHLKKVAVLKAAMFPLVGAVVGGVVGGPIGFVAGVKVGLTAGVAMAGGVTGSVLGYQGGKFLKKKHENNIEDKQNNLNNKNKIS